MRHDRVCWPARRCRGQMLISLSVQNDEYVLVQTGDVVECLEHDAGGECPVSDDGDGFSVAVSEQVVASLETGNGGNAAPGVPRS